MKRFALFLLGMALMVSLAPGIRAVFTDDWSTNDMSKWDVQGGTYSGASGYAALTNTPASPFGMATVNTTLFSNAFNVSVSGQVYLVDTSTVYAHSGLMVRYYNATDWIKCWVSLSEHYIRMYRSTGYVDLGSNSTCAYSYGTWYTANLTASGNTYTCVIGSCSVVATDTAYQTAGAVGIAQRETGQRFDNFVATSNDGGGADTTPPSISWNTPATNSTVTQNQNWAYFNATVSETGGSAILNINSTTNYTMSWSNNYSYYNLTGLGNSTVCGRVYANDSTGNLNWSTVMCVNINLTSTAANVSYFYEPFDTNATIAESWDVLAGDFFVNTTTSALQSVSTAGEPANRIFVKEANFTSVVNVSINGTLKFIGAGGTEQIGPIFRYTDANNFYTAIMSPDTSMTNVTWLRMYAVVGGSNWSEMYNANCTQRITLGGWYSFSSSMIGNKLNFTVWNASGFYCSGYGNDTTFLNAGRTGFRIQKSGQQVDNITIFNSTAGPATIPSISWNVPATNSTVTQNQSWIYWNVTLSTTPSSCTLTTNTSNNTMSISGNYCYYNSTSLTNQTTYCSFATGLDDSGGASNKSTTMCVTVNLTSSISVVTLTLPTSGTKHKGTNYTIQAWYNDSGTPISGATCVLDSGFLTDLNGTRAMAWNATTSAYEINMNFGIATGTHPYSVTCSKAGYVTNTSSQSYTTESGYMGFYDYGGYVEFGNDNVIYRKEHKNYGFKNTMIVRNASGDWIRWGEISMDPEIGGSMIGLPWHEYDYFNYTIYINGTIMAATQANADNAANITYRTIGCYVAYSSCSWENYTLYASSQGFPYKYTIKFNSGVWNGSFSEIIPVMNVINWTSSVQQPPGHEYRYLYPDIDNTLVMTNLGAPAWGWKSIYDTGWGDMAQHKLTNDTGGYLVMWNNRSAASYPIIYTFANKTTPWGDDRSIQGWLEEHIDCTYNCVQGQHENGLDDMLIYTPIYYGGTGWSTNSFTAGMEVPDIWFTVLPSMDMQMNNDSDSLPNSLDPDHTYTYSGITQNQSYALYVRNYFLGGTLGDGAGDTTPPSPVFVSPTLANQSYTQNQSWIFINVSAGEDLNTCLLDIYPNAANTTITTSDAYEIRYDQLSTYATDTEHGDVGRLSGSPPTYTRTIVPFPTAGITANVTQANLSFTIDSDGFPVFGNGFTLSIFYNISFNYNDTYCRANASTKGQCWNITDMPGTWIGNITIGADNSTYSMDMTSAFNNDHSDGLLNVWFKSDRENQSILTDAVTIIVDTLEVGHIWPSVYYYPLSYQNISMTLAASSRSAYYNATDLVNATAYYFRAWCNDTSGNLNKTEDRQITINLTGADTTPPDISWNTPSVNNTATANTTLLGFNVTVSETGGSAILNINGTTNYTMNWAGNYAYYTFNGANQTTYCGRVYANDTSGNLNLSTSSRCITVNLYSGGGDITPPTITITSPGNTSYKNASIKIDFYIYPDDLGFSVTGYCLNENYYTCSNPEPGGPLDCNRVLGSNCSGNICWVCSSPYFTAPQGQNFLDFLTSDNVGNYNQTRIYFTVDSIHPSPQFVSPTLSNNSYTSNVTWIYVNVSAGEALNSCTLDWNGANQTMTLGGNYCYKNMTSLTNGTAYYFRVFANDTIGNMNVTEWRKITVRLLDFVTSYVQTQTANVIEQTSHAFTLNFTTTETATVLASLVYDGTTYSASRIVLDANSTYFTASVTSPTVSSTSENKDWHWAVTINGAGLDTATEQQAVYKMILTNCSAGSESTTKALWYYLKDEESGSPITGTFAVTYDISDGGSFERSYPFNFTGQNNYSVCIYPAWASYYADAIGAYNSSGYLQRSYYLTNHLISNSTESVNLLLSSVSSTLVTITVVDTVANPQEGIDIIVQRYYPDTGIYEQVYSLRTGADGKTIAYMIPYDVWYKFILSKDGTILRTVNPMVITSSTLTLTIDYPTYGNPYEYRGGVASSCAWNSTTSVLSCTVVDTTGKMTNACLNVSKYGAVGMEDEFEVCSDSNSSTLIWTGGNASQFMYPYEVKAYFPDTNILVDNGVIGSKHELYDTMGDYAIIIALIIVFVVAFLSITANPVIPIVMSCVAMIAGFALGVLPIGLSGLASIIVAGAVIILKMRT